MKIIHTKRLILRTWTMQDLDDFYEYAKHPEVGPSAGWQPHKNKEETTIILQSFIEQGEVWAIVDQETNCVIGSLGLHKDARRNNPSVKMMGYVLAQPYWGQGLMQEAASAVLAYAFDELQLDLISIAHYSFNHQSRRVIEKCGFLYEGTLRRAHKHGDGTIYDTLCYSMTKEEFIRK